MRECKHCGYGNKDEAKFCKGCGKELVLLSTHYEGGGLPVKEKSSAREGFECILFCIVVIGGIIAMSLVWYFFGDLLLLIIMIGFLLFLLGLLYAFLDHIREWRIDKKKKKEKKSQ